MKYYKLIYDYENDNKFINCNIGYIGNMDEYVTSNGILVKDWDTVVFEYNSEKGDVMSDYIANIYRWLIVSKDCCCLFDKIIPHTLIQYLPVKLIDIASGAINETYKVVNILDVIDALDLEHSKYDEFKLDDEKIISVKKYALKATEVKDHNIFRLKNDTIPIFISEKVRKIMEEQSLRGFAFLEVAVY